MPKGLHPQAYAFYLDHPFPIAPGLARQVHNYKGATVCCKYPNCPRAGIDVLRQAAVDGKKPAAFYSWRSMLAHLIIEHGLSAHAVSDGLQN